MSPRATLTEQLVALRAAHRRLAARVAALEAERHQELTAAIGFEVESVEVEDEAEYVLTAKPARSRAAADSCRKPRRRS